MMELKIASRFLTDEAGKLRRLHYFLLVDELEAGSFFCAVDNGRMRARARRIPLGGVLSDPAESFSATGEVPGGERTEEETMSVRYLVRDLDRSSGRDQEE